MTVETTLNLEDHPNCQSALSIGSLEHVSRFDDDDGGSDGGAGGVSNCSKNKFFDSCYIFYCIRG